MRVAKDGREIDVSLRISLIYDADDRLVGASSISRSITRQKQLELQLRRSSRYFDLARDLTVATGFDGRFKSVNPRSSASWGGRGRRSSRGLRRSRAPRRPRRDAARAAKLAAGEVSLSFVNRYEAKTARTAGWTGTRSSRPTSR